jgi:signal transduction histidine kinase
VTRVTISPPSTAAARPTLAAPPVVASPTALSVSAIAVAATVSAAIVVALGLASPEPPPAIPRTILACWVSVPYVVAGLISWRRRPDSRLGILMLTAGFVTSANFLVWANNDLLYTLGIATQFLPPVLLLHLFLAFPSGRLTTTGSRRLVGAAYIMVALTIPDVLLGLAAPRNRFGILYAPGFAERLQKVQLLGIATLLVAGTVILIHRRRAAGRPPRRALDVLVEAFSLSLVMIATLLVVGFLELTTIQEPIRLATFAVVGAAPLVFLAGLLQARLQRTSVEGLVAELGERPRPAELQAAVARALRDPSATLAYWVPEFRSWADIDGHQVDLAAPPGRTATVVRHDHTTVAVVLHDATLDDEPELLAAVSAVVGVTVENARLHVELRARVEELRGSRSRILAAEQRARRRLERDLHDGAQQRMVALSLQLGELSRQFDGDAELAARIQTARDTVQESLSELRDLAKGIYPATLTDHGLSVALETLATQATVPVRIVDSLAARPPPAVELAAFYVVSESLTNVMKHARASTVEVRLRTDRALLVVEVSDDGIGGAASDRGSGLRGLADRVEGMGGRIRVRSPAGTGTGTTVRAELPCTP